MLDRMLSTLENQVVPAILSRIGLNEQQTHDPIHAATERVQQVITVCGGCPGDG